MSAFSFIERYRPIVDDFAALVETLARPLPCCLRTNTLRLAPAELAAHLAAKGLAPQPVPWCPDAFLLPPETRLGREWEFLSGYCQVQEEASLLPVLLLAPEPGQRVLDLCAAPGNKTAHLAALMHNRGTLVANELNSRRVKPLCQTVERLGLANVAVTNENGANFPRAAGLFDRILIDAPCSCEGTYRKSSEVAGRSGPEYSRRLASCQKALLRKAVQLCRAGGRMVYATCTFAPEENELVVQAILREYGPGVVRLCPVAQPGLRLTPGLTEWEGQALDPALAQTARLWPHHNDTGGFFVALLEKVAPLPRDREGEHPALLPLPDAPEAPGTLTQLAARYGLAPELFAPYRLVHRDAALIVAAPRDFLPPATPAVTHLGLPFVRLGLEAPKLSTPSVLHFGTAVRQNVLDIDAEQLAAYFDRDLMPLRPVNAGQATPGYVFLRHCGRIVGLALYWPDRETGELILRSQFPKRWQRRDRSPTTAGDAIPPESSDRDER